MALQADYFYVFEFLPEESGFSPLAITMVNLPQANPEDLEALGNAIISAYNGFSFMGGTNWRLVRVIYMHPQDDVVWSEE